MYMFVFIMLSFFHYGVLSKCFPFLFPKIFIVSEVSKFDVVGLVTSQKFIFKLMLNVEWYTSMFLSCGCDVRINVRLYLQGFHFVRLQ